MADEPLPSGCPGCDPDGAATMLAVLAERGIKVSEVPRPRHAWHDVVPCENCGRAWLMQKAKADAIRKGDGDAG